MSSKKMETPKYADECILKMGKSNNVIQWRDEMHTAVTRLYGMTGSFFITNERYVEPLPRAEDYTPIIPEGEDDEDNELDEELLRKLRDGAYQSRRKAMLTQAVNERTVWPLMWAKMSAGSQSKVREEPEFEEAFLNLDCVRLWNFIRRTHLTHVFGDGDQMRVVNIQEQEVRYSELKQGDREFISTFKTRFDNQVKANEGAGLPAQNQPKLALEFLFKLDMKRYKDMLVSMRNDAIRDLPDAYPQTLAAAFRIAQGWTGKELTQKEDGQVLSAFVTDEAEQPSKQKQSKPLSSIICFVCGEKGHLARNCDKRAGKEIAMLTKAEEEIDRHTALSTTESNETALFTRYDVLLDNEASLNIFRDKELLTNVRTSDRLVKMKGVENESNGVLVTEEGTFRDLGKVFYSNKASANILSFASQIDAGASITYNQDNDSFTMIPRSRQTIYTFGRKATTTGERRMYICDTRTMAVPLANEEAMIQTIDNNKSHYTKADIERADRAKHLISVMGHQ